MRVINVCVSEEIHEACPKFRGCMVSAEITNTPYNEELWAEIEKETERLTLQHDTESIKRISGIAATRNAYKRCGKDPSRYRPSNEQLIRRVIQGKGLYQINTVVDLVNLASIRYGYSIGGFDLEKVVGDEVALGIGQEGEPYEGIGRGALNIAGMPVYRDSAGGIGTPTSDHERTKLSLETTQFLAFVNGYDGNDAHTLACGQFIAELLKRYAMGEDVTVKVFGFRGC